MHAWRMRTEGMLLQSRTQALCLAARGEGAQAPRAQQGERKKEKERREKEKEKEKEKEMEEKRKETFFPTVRFFWTKFFLLCVFTTFCVW